MYSFTEYNFLTKLKNWKSSPCIDTHQIIVTKLERFTPWGAPIVKCILLYFISDCFAGVQWPSRQPHWAILHSGENHWHMSIPSDCVFLWSDYADVIPCGVSVRSAKHIFEYQSFQNCNPQTLLWQNYRICVCIYSMQDLFQDFLMQMPSANPKGGGSKSMGTKAPPAPPPNCWYCKDSRINYLCAVLTLQIVSTPKHMHVQLTTPWGYFKHSEIMLFNFWPYFGNFSM